MWEVCLFIGLVLEKETPCRRTFSSPSAKYNSSFRTLAPGDDAQVQREAAGDTRSQVKGISKVSKNRLAIPAPQKHSCPQNQVSMVPGRVELIWLHQKAATNIMGCRHWESWKLNQSVPGADCQSLKLICVEHLGQPDNQPLPCGTGSTLKPERLEKGQRKARGHLCLILRIWLQSQGPNCHLRCSVSTLQKSVTMTSWRTFL